MPETQPLIPQISGLEEALATRASVSVTQAGHNFVVGNAVRFNGSTYVRSQADSAAHAEVIGLVWQVPNANNFKYISSGVLRDLSGLTPGEIYFLSPTTPGGMTTTEPSTTGQVSKPVLQAVSATEGTVLNFRGCLLTEVADWVCLEVPAGNLGTDTNYVLDFPPVGGKAMVFIDGAVKDPTLYGITSNTITFSSAPSGTLMLVSYFKT